MVPEASIITDGLRTEWCADGLLVRKLTGEVIHFILKAIVVDKTVVVDALIIPLRY